MAITVHYIQANRGHDHTYENGNSIVVQDSGALLVRRDADVIGAYPADKWVNAYDSSEAK